MKSERLLDALGKIDDELILEAAPGNKPSKKNSKRMLWIKWGTMAACAVVIVGSGILFVFRGEGFVGEKSEVQETESFVVSEEGQIEDSVASEDAKTENSVATDTVGNSSEKAEAGVGEADLETLQYMEEIKVKIDEMLPDGFVGTIEAGNDLFRQGKQITIIVQDNVTVVQKDGTIFAYDEMEPNIPESDLTIGSSVWVGFQSYDYVAGNGKYNQIFAYHVDAKKRDVEAEVPAGQGYFNAVVLAVAEDNILVECMDSFLGEIAVGDKVKVSTNNISGEKVPEVKNGDKVRVLYIGEITGTETLVLEKTVSIFLLDDDNEVIVE